MYRVLHHALNRKSFRHILFWSCWVMGFTFIQGFGQSIDIYFGWFSYYILTLPLFMAHAYLVAYVLIPRFLNKQLFPLFALFFLMSVYGFSMLELLLSNEFIFRWYPTGTEIRDDYLAPGNVIISGLGNLYIVLVFLSAKIIRQWYLDDRKRKILQKEQLRKKIDETMIRAQPSMLLYAIDHIARMAEKSPDRTSRAISLTSEILNEVMSCYGERCQLINREIVLVKKLALLVSLFREKKPEVEFFVSGEPARLQIPPLILFSFTDIIFRGFDQDPEIPEISIEASGFSNMITIQVLTSRSREQKEQLEECMKSIRQLELTYEKSVRISCKIHGYGCSAVIRKADHTDDAGLDGNSLDPAKKVVCSN